MLKEIKVVTSADGDRCYSIDKSVDLEKAFNDMILDLGWSGLPIKPGKVIAIIGPTRLGNYNHYLYDGLGDTFSDREIKRLSNVLRKEYDPYRLEGRFYADAKEDETRITRVFFYSRGYKIMSVSRIYHLWYLDRLFATSNLLAGMIPYVKKLLQIDNPKDDDGFIL